MLSFWPVVIATITALATIFIAVFSFTLWQITGRSVKLAREEFTATQRPKLRVRLVRIDKLEAGKAVVIHFEVINVGYSRAKAVVAETTLQILNVLGENRDRESRKTEKFHIADEIAPGQPRLVKKTTGTICSKDWKVKDDWAGDGRVRVHGTIIYADDNGIGRRTGFYRYSTRDVNRFRRPGDHDIEHDYEYED